ncbi:MAG: hypothetical protein KatS3mg100_573 [Candidatus Parcubacteria bacterium]|nr:MAG: hypothetical protein KatS3mg100_573 [Candidatus Parcubacteria bacterium]
MARAGVGNTATSPSKKCKQTSHSDPLTVPGEGSRVCGRVTDRKERGATPDSVFVPSSSRAWVVRSLRRTADAIEAPHAQVAAADILHCG